MQIISAVLTTSFTASLSPSKVTSISISCSSVSFIFSRVVATNSSARPALLLTMLIRPMFRTDRMASICISAWRPAPNTSKCRRLFDDVIQSVATALPAAVRAAVKYVPPNNALTIPVLQSTSMTVAGTVGRPRDGLPPLTETNFIPIREGWLPPTSLLVSYMAGLKSVQSSAAAAEEEPRYGNPIRVGTVAPPSPALLSEPSARLLASIGALHW